MALARVLAHPVELLVLDEPTNHLDLGAVAWLEQRLLAFRGGLVLVTHDRHLLDRLTNRMLELDRGRAYVHEGGYELYLAAKAEREDQAAAAEPPGATSLDSELAWLRRGAQARSRKPKARIDTAVRLIEGGPVAPVASAEIEAGHDLPRLGDKVIECIGVGFRYDDGPPVLSGVDLSIGRAGATGDRRCQRHREVNPARPPGRTAHAHHRDDRGRADRGRGLLRPAGSDARPGGAS